MLSYIVKHLPRRILDLKNSCVLLLVTVARKYTTLVLDVYSLKTIDSLNEEGQNPVAQ